MFRKRAAVLIFRRSVRLPWCFLRARIITITRFGLFALGIFILRTEVTETVFAKWTFAKSAKLY